MSTAGEQESDEVAGKVNLPKCRNRRVSMLGRCQKGNGLSLLDKQWSTIPM